MRLPQSASEPSAALEDAQPAPFAAVTVTLTKQEHIQLVMDVSYWRIQFERRVARQARHEQQYRRLFGRLKAQFAQREAQLVAELELANARVRALQQRVFGRKSERSKGASERRGQAMQGHKSRGQQPGATGHGRTSLPRLPGRVEVVGLDDARCPQCGQALQDFPGTEDCEVIEIEVQAYRRVSRRRRYRPLCNCGCMPGIVTAPSPPRLIERGKFGISVWVSVLLDKYLYGRPSHRLLQDLADHGLTMSPGTLTGGLQAIAPLFEPLEQALVTKLRSEPHWHADETRWAVFVVVEGKAGHRWYLWVFHSSSVIHYVLDETRSAEVVEAELAGVHEGIISCDRYSAYKKFARLHPRVILAFCWAHQRRDFLELGNAYPDLLHWALGWVAEIGELYHLNDVRLRANEGSVERAAAQAALEQAAQRMGQEREAQLARPELAEPALKVLQSMQAHWCGLTVFVEHAWVPMDNSSAERDMRTPVVGRKNFYGSGSLWSARLAAMMYSLLMTARLWKLNARTWLSAFMLACAENGNRAPRDITAFLPWTMDEARLAAMRAGVPTRKHIEAIDSS